MDHASQAIQLERQIQSLRSRIAGLEIRHSEHSSRAIGLRRSLLQVEIKTAYLEFVNWFRSPQKSFELWPLGVLLIGPTALGGMVLILVHHSSDSLYGAFVWAAIAAAITVVTLACFLFVPSTECISDQLRIARDAIRRLKNQLAPVLDELHAVAAELRECRSELASKEGSILLHRRRLLQRDWRGLRGVDWENYLSEVCSALGATVELTKTSGDQGVDLVAVFGTRRVAIQAKGWSNSVGNSAVQEVVSGQRFYNCSACAVITNSRFTSSAIQLAKVNGCSLISEENFEAFVMGDVTL